MHQLSSSLMVILQLTHVTICCSGTAGIGFPQFSFVYAASTVTLVPNNSGQHLFVAFPVVVATTFTPKKDQVM